MNLSESETLVRLDERTKNIEEKLDSLIKHADNGGWTRCAIHNEQLSEVIKKQVTHREGHTWVMRLLVATALASCFSAVGSLFLLVCSKFNSIVPIIK